MALNMDEILKNKAFQNIEPERIKAFQKLGEQLEGKNINQSMEIILEFSKNMPKGRDLTKQEEQAMMDVMLRSLPEVERNKFNAMIKMMEMMRK